MTKKPTTDDWPVERGWTLNCSRCKKEGRVHEDFWDYEYVISLFEERGWTMELDGVWRAYCPACTKWRKVMV